MLKPNDVFTPGKLPIRPNNVYASRGETEKDFTKAFGRGLVPLVYGEYGVGKTSMARYSLRSVEDNGRLVYIQSVANKSLADIFAVCLEKMGYAVQKKRVSGEVAVKGKEESGKAEAGIGWLKAVVASKTTKSSSSSNSIEEEIAVTSPTDSKILELCEQHEFVLLLDEVHRSTSEFTDELAKFIKAYGNANCQHFKVALLGTSSEASKLVRYDPGIDRLIQEIHLGAMKEGEANYLVVKGMGDLDIDIPASAIDRLLKTSVGSPNILQYLCLETAESAFVRTPRSATLEDVSKALSEYVEKKEPRLYSMYMKGIETMGKVRYRKLILRAMSEADDEYVTTEYIRHKVSEYLNKEVPGSALSGPLRNLKETKYGPLLSDVDRPGGEGRVLNFSTFVDPSLKAFIRMLEMREEERGKMNSVESQKGELKGG